ncbi:hypothetical protein [Natrinema sp. H-ect4]|jgi:hypothetical protein|uniref:hypothetical protein n=1 Tax=Natrinema sp. H-ect4 TaxID=3242699 RepID=UPI0035A96415
MTDRDSGSSGREAAGDGDDDRDERSSFPPCPKCDDAVITVTTRGPMEHIAGPCGCRLSPGQVQRL